jgi:hypothetical protein
MNDMSVSLSGVDGTGKSTQIKLLYLDNKKIFHVTKPLVAYSNRWKKARGIEMSKWWFEDVPLEMLTDIIIESLNARNSDRTDSKIQLLDRGWMMFKAVCASTWVTRDNQMSIDAATEAIDEMFLKRLDYKPEETEILLVPDQSYFETVRTFIQDSKRPLEREVFPDNVEARYARYQANLRLIMARYFARPEVQLVAVDSSACNINDKIRRGITSVSGVEIAKLIDKLRTIVGFSGLSESGKSSFAEHLRKELAFTRLKLRYFIEVLERKEISRTDEDIVFELLLFIRRHYYIDKISLESLHDPYVPAILKLMLGDRFQLVYLDTVKEKRVHRASLQGGGSTLLHDVKKEIEVKDALKIERGVQDVAKLADIVLDNNQDDFSNSMQKLLSKLDLS